MHQSFVQCIVHAATYRLAIDSLVVNISDQLPPPLEILTKLVKPLDCYNKARGL